MKIFQLTIIFLFTTLLATAQLPTLQWVNKMEGGNSKTMAINCLSSLCFVAAIGSKSNFDVDISSGLFILDGANTWFTYSPIITAVTVFPKPVANVINGTVKGLKIEFVSFSLYSAEAKLVSTRHVNLIKGSNLFT